MLAGVNDRVEQARAARPAPRPEGVQGQPDPVQPDRVPSTARRATRSPRSRPSSTGRGSRRRCASPAAATSTPPAGSSREGPATTPLIPFRAGRQPSGESSVNSRQRRTPRRSSRCGHAPAGKPPGSRLRREVWAGRYPYSGVEAIQARSGTSCGLLEPAPGEQRRDRVAQVAADDREQPQLLLDLRLRQRRDRLDEAAPHATVRARSCARGSAQARPGSMGRPAQPRAAGHSDLTRRRCRAAPAGTARASSRRRADGCGTDGRRRGRSRACAGPSPAAPRPGRTGCAARSAR